MHLYHLPSARIPFLGLRLQILNQRLLGRIEKRTNLKEDGLKKRTNWTEKWTQLCWLISFSPERFGACNSSVSSKTKNVPFTFWSKVISISQYQFSNAVHIIHTLDVRTPDMGTKFVCSVFSTLHPSKEPFYNSTALELWILKVWLAKKW